MLKIEPEFSNFVTYVMLNDYLTLEKFSKNFKKIADHTKTGQFNWSKIGYSIDMTNAK